MKTETPTVRVGQVWADNDPRAKGRTLRIKRIVGDKAWCVILTNRDGVQQYLDAGSKDFTDRRGTATGIKLSRFRPTSAGYRLIEDAQGGEPA